MDEQNQTINDINNPEAVSTEENNTDTINPEASEEGQNPQEMQYSNQMGGQPQNPYQMGSRPQQAYQQPYQANAGQPQNPYQMGTQPQQAYQQPYQANAGQPQNPYQMGTQPQQAYQQPYQANAGQPQNPYQMGGQPQQAYQQPYQTNPGQFQNPYQMGGQMPNQGCGYNPYGQYNARKQDPIAIISGIMMIIYAVSELVNVFKVYYGGLYRISYLIFLAAFVCMAVYCFKDDIKNMAVFASAGFILGLIINCIANCVYYNSLTGIHTSEYRIEAFDYLALIIKLAAYIVLLLMTIQLTTDNSNLKIKNLQTLWFLPGILMGVAVVVSKISTIVYQYNYSKYAYYSWYSYSYNRFELSDCFYFSDVFSVLLVVVMILVCLLIRNRAASKQMA